MDNNDENKKELRPSSYEATTSRRKILKSTLGIGAGIAGMGILGGVSQPASAGLVSDLVSTALEGNFRIDVHCHLIPDFYRTSLAEYGITTAGGIPLPPWSPVLAVGFMNQHGIQTQVLSVSEPGVYYLPSSNLRQDMAWQINNYLANDLINSEDPLIRGRFGGFAVMPLGDANNANDIQNSITEAERAIYSLNLDGIGLYSNYHGLYLGDPALDPLMEKLNDMEAMVFLHPVTPSAMPDIALPTFLFEFPFDTTRAVVNMLYHNVFTRFPNIRWLIAHAGGTVPFLAYRTSLLQLYPGIAQELGIGGSLQNGGLAYAKLFYDTALSPTPSAMKSVLEVTSSSHILFATDWPFSSPLFLLPGDPAPQLAETFQGSDLNNVLRNNALSQLPTVKARIGA